MDDLLETFLDKETEQTGLCLQTQTLGESILCPYPFPSVLKNKHSTTATTEAKGNLYQLQKAERHFQAHKHKKNTLSIPYG